MRYTTEKLLEAIERRSFVPSGQTTFSDTEILAIADEILRNDILPNIMNLKEEFFVNHKQYSIVSGQQNYSIPARAIGSITREIHFISVSGNVGDIQRIEPEEIDHVSRTSSIPESFFIKNASIWLHPVPNADSGSIRVYFPLRPSDHVAAASATTVQSIDTATKIVTVVSPPSAWVAGDIFDFISKDGNHSHLDQGYDLESTLVSGSDVTFSTLPSKLRVGDYIALQGETPVVQLPAEYRDLLAQGAACFIMEKMNLSGKDYERKQYDKNLEGVQAMLSPRTQGSPRNIPAPNFL